MVLGCYYLTLNRPGGLGEGKLFADPLDAYAAYEAGIIGKHSVVTIRMGEPHGTLDTTIGRMIFNEIIPNSLGYVNEPLNKKALSRSGEPRARRRGHDRLHELPGEPEEPGLPPRHRGRHLHRHR